VLTFIVQTEAPSNHSARTALWRFYERYNITFEKTLYAAEQRRADVIRTRRGAMRGKSMFVAARLAAW